MKALSEKLHNHYSVLLAVCTGLYFFASVETVSVIDYTSFASLFKILRYLCYLAFGLLALAAMGDFSLDNPSRFFRSLMTWIGSHVIFLAASVLAVITSFTSRGLEPIVLVLIVTAASFSPLPDLFLGALCGMAAGFMLVALLAATGVIENYVFVRESDVRYALGFIYPLEAQSVVLMMSLLILVLFWKKLNFVICLGVFVLNVLIYLLTKGRMSLIMAALACLLFWICHQIPQKQMKAVLCTPWMRAIMWICLILVFVLPLILCSQFDWSELWMTIDSYTNGRIRFGYQGLRDYGIPLFGQQVTWVGLGGAADGEAFLEATHNYNYVDTAYLKMLIDYGWIAGLTVFMGYGFTMDRLMRKGRTAGLCALTIILLVSLSEPRLIQIAMNPFLLYLAPALCTQNRGLKFTMEDPHVPGLKAAGGIRS